MENKYNFLTPNIFTLTYDDFCKLVEIEMRNFEIKYRNTPIEKRTSNYIQIWINVNIELIPNEYLIQLKKDLIKLNWIDVKVEKQNDRSSCIYICLIK